MASGGVARRPALEALKGGHGERLRRRKQPQQAPSAQAKQVMRSPPGANFLHSEGGQLELHRLLELVHVRGERLDRLRLRAQHPRVVALRRLRRPQVKLLEDGALLWIRPRVRVRLRLRVRVGGLGSGWRAGFGLALAP